MRFAMELSKTKLQNVVLVNVVTLVVVAIVWRFYTGAQWARWNGNKMEIATLEIQVKEAEMDAQKTVESQEARRQISAFVQTQQNTMVTGDLFAWAVREISLLGEQHALRIVSLRPLGITPHRKKTRYEVFTVGIELAGGYDEIGLFVRDMENQFPTAEVRSMEMTGGEIAGRERHANINVELLVRPRSFVKPEQGRKT